MAGWLLHTEKYPTGLCTTYKQACILANDHAKNIFPNLTAIGAWSNYRLEGGEQYREWLVTLPHYAPSYFSEHYQHRNVLIHVRCDLREDTDGNRVLLLHEIQSDWAQEARRSLKGGGDPSEWIPSPPWLHEWPALALKLMLLHASRQDAAALVWTHGYVQVERWNGLGKNGLLKFYDHELPKYINKILHPYGKKCENIEVYKPINYHIDPVEIGYEVRDEDHNLLGTAKTWEEAQKLLPDGAHEMLEPMHGVRLDETLRKKILKNGFFAWGAGIK